MVEFRVLGSLEVLGDGNRVCTPTTPKVRVVLTMLLLRAGRVVSTDALIDELWSGAPPRSALTTTQTYIYQLRKLFVREGAPARTIRTRDPGYVLDVPEDRVDAAVFSRLIDEARTLLRDGRPEDAVDRLGRAQRLWRGAPLSNVAAGALLGAHTRYLEEERIRALELQVDAEMRLGRHRELLPELRRIVAAYPLNEWFHGRLMVALQRSGRRVDALHAYHDLRHLLTSELGMEPSADVRELLQDVLAG